MVALQIRHVPDAVRDALSAEAERRGESLQVYLLDVLTRESASAQNRRLIRQWAVQPVPEEISVDLSELISRQRADREAHLADTSLTARHVGR